MATATLCDDCDAPAVVRIDGWWYCADHLRMRSREDRW